MQKILSALAGLFFSANAFAVDADLLVYQVNEEGVDPYISRILVTDNFVRLDEGASSDGYTLFDRKKGVIYNISLTDQSVLEIAPALQEIPEHKGLILTQRDEVDAQAPKVAGVQPHNVELLANGETCTQLVALPGLMPEAVKALMAFKAVLARVQAAGAASRPMDLQGPCDLAVNVHGATRVYEHGLPLMERDAGRTQHLADFSDAHAVDEKLFTIPEGFNRILMPQLPAL